ncbi:hypothetical protein SEA_LUMOS_136 [Mycobacterium phage Lumos]|uniref:Uncharacterized protein n=1 Tax=Mycobacterium phage Lumos TaxID=1701852 RepID=A0A0K2CM84_9CAUD|nr:hypothetical protein AVU96_gp053 [Mycobacterium phage Snenia]YP_010012584.1 hypothetical protein J4T93_gp052 [Mycobacterium phage Lumos]ASM62857.1 hypothetical protein SEA_CLAUTASTROPHE_129 [Mycobacterium phage Clautastrophe]QDF16707.1 hypothetical protein PBI_MSGREEN_137 [Mycobacterium phage MsGreen]QPL15011.1 hypothetical protein SEA_JUBIE_137 [Mycobacterium phage Jubie]ALA06642.1 hypothetical protein SEA_LUMOS_136 [Mycobacterium phage Lumos]ALF01582.1 hypothetical protein SNENIA_136 [My
MFAMPEGESFDVDALVSALNAQGITPEDIDAGTNAFVQSLRAEGVTVTRVRYTARRSVVLLALCVLLGAGLAALALHGPTATASADVVRCVVWQDTSGNVYADDCQRYSD